MANESLSIELIIPPLPEGWAGTPDDFRRFLMENASFVSTGSGLTGQIGGTRPTEDVGLWINGRDIEVWDSALAKYVPINTDPVGAVHYYAGISPPTNYLFCQGQLLVKTDYTDLYAVIGDTYKKEADPADQFRLPDLQGRYVVGAGVGDYNPKGTGTINGKIKEMTLGDYLGFEWLNRVEAAGPNTPAGSGMRSRLGLAPYGLYYNSKNFTSPRPMTLVLNSIIKAK